MSDMRIVINEVFRVLGNHRRFVLNVADVTCDDGSGTSKKFAIPAHFIVACEDAGFSCIDDYIWDKGEVQTNRLPGKDDEYPYYIYPANCYEHVIVFQKDVRDTTRIPCPACGSLQTQMNSKTRDTIVTWECNNEDCSHRSPSNRGKRFSARSVMMNAGRIESNRVPRPVMQRWRRDVVSFPPVIKIDAGGKNKAGHSAPYPVEIPRWAIAYHSHVGDVILDPFAGIFTTTVAAIKLNRNSIGIEISKDHVAAAKKRLQIGKLQSTLFGEVPRFIMKTTNDVERDGIIFSTDIRN